MGAAAYYRGNAVISRGIQQNIRPPCDCGFVADHEAIRHAAMMAARIEKAAAAFARLQALVTHERRVSAAMVAAVEGVYQKAKTANADVSTLYWLTLARVRIEASRTAE